VARFARHRSSQKLDQNDPALASGGRSRGRLLPVYRTLDDLNFLIREIIEIVYDLIDQPIGFLGFRIQLRGAFPDR